ncbi:cytochrome P450 [Actinomadura citrea]|uniref:cytochrome P450 n=1 Tax=Actinomadura citrea TaxID=46158 RepID=UPI002E2D98E7|nr:cytochrome P450 [Actinomadura citrea]
MRRPAATWWPGSSSTITRARWVWATWHGPPPGGRNRSHGPVHGRVGDWIEETLRLEAPAQADGRTVTAEFTLHGVTVPAGARMLLVIGAADRDPRVFA